MKCNFAHASDLSRLTEYDASLYHISTIYTFLCTLLIVLIKGCLAIQVKGSVSCPKQAFLALHGRVRWMIWRISFNRLDACGRLAASLFVIKNALVLPIFTFVLVNWRKSWVIVVMHVSSWMNC